MILRDSQALSPDGAISSRATRTVSATAAAYAITGGILTLTGWKFDLVRLTDWNNDNISMFPNTAICAMLAGAALILDGLYRSRGWQQLAVRLLSGCVALISTLTLFQHITDIDLGIDRLLFDKSWGQGASSSPMRMGPPATISFLILSVAIFLTTLDSEARRLAGESALLVMAIAMLSLVGYLFGANQLFGIARITGIAWQTSTILAALSISVMASVPDHGIIAALLRNDAGGTVLRRLILPIIVVPLLMGWLRLWAQEAGYLDLEFGTALRTVCEIILLTALVWWTANGISKHARAARLAEEANRQADRRKDEFLATLAHELRNPLAPIGNALQLIKYAENDPVMLRQSRETMQRQFAQMVRLVDDLLDVSRISRDKLDLRKERVELQSLISQCVDSSRAVADNSGHIFHVVLPSNPIWLEADPVRVAQVFNNLLNNACKFTDANGSISIVAAREGANAIVTVKDNGIGIASGNLASIFEMFEQLDKTLARTRGGLGIGLTLVKRLVELHGGSISARSDGLGHGSTFVVRLPLLQETQPAASEPAAPSHSSKPQRILVTDDNRDAADSLAILLKLGGHQVDVAYDGNEAIEKAKASPPDVMLLDIGLPGKSGYEVCRSIREQPWGKRIRIVAVTGWGQEQDRRNTHDAGFDHHLVKPVTPTALSEALAVR